MQRPDGILYFYSRGISSRYESICNNNCEVKYITIQDKSCNFFKTMIQKLWVYTRSQYWYSTLKIFLHYFLRYLPLPSLDRTTENLVLAQKVDPPLITALNMRIRRKDQ